MVAFTAEDKAQVYSRAIIEALAAAGNEVGGPDINAAIGALAFAQGYLIAKITDRNLRRRAEAGAVEALGNMIAQQVNERIVREQKQQFNGGETQ